MMRRRLVWLGSAAAVIGIAGLLLARARVDGPSSVGTRAAPPPAASAEIVSGALRFDVAAEGTATFLIDAPLEKIKGRSNRLRGSLDVDSNDLTTTRGQVDLDLGALATETFDDPGKNATQTEHTHNWLEIGPSVPAEEREQNRWARFTIGAIEQAEPRRIADAPEVGGARIVKIRARGELWLHGVTSPKSVRLTVAFRGPATAPTSLSIVSDEPMRISLAEHGVEPRDVAGKLLVGALERVGKKIDDSVQVSLALTARQRAAVGQR